MPTTNYQLRKAKTAGLLFGIIALIELVIFAVPYLLGVRLEINLLIAIHDILSLIATLTLVSVVVWVQLHPPHSSWSRGLLIGSLIAFASLGLLTLGFNIIFVEAPISFRTVNLASYASIRSLVFLLVGWQFYQWFDQQIPNKPLTLVFGNKEYDLNWLLITGIFYLLATIFLVPTNYFLFEQERILSTGASISEDPFIGSISGTGAFFGYLAYITLSFALSLFFIGFITQFWTGYEIYKKIDEVESAHSESPTEEYT
ncbi:MAG: hypothetical protein ACFFCZ_13200 [Promethearchaeota archaeon]